MNNLKKARKAAGMTQAEVSKAIGISQGGYSMWEKGLVKVDTETATKLADLFGVTVDYLLGRESERPAVVRVPVYGSVPAGIPLEAIEDVTDWEELPADVCSGGREYFALRVKGDSMTGARIHDGDIVYIRRQDDVKDGQIAAVIIDDEATLKRVYHVRNGLQLLSENPKYPPMLFTLDDHGSIRILGKAVGFTGRL